MLTSQDQQTITPSGPAFERHYSIKEISKLWGLNVDTVRKVFASQEDVLRIINPESLHKRAYTTLKVPESVVRRVHHRLTKTTGKPI